MSIEALLADVVVALNKNTDTLSRVIEGQALALAKIDAVNKTSTRTPRATKTDAATTTQAAGEPAATNTTTAVAEVAAPTMGMDELKALASGWMKGTTDPTEQAARVEFLTKVLPPHFGTATLVGPTGIDSPEQRAQAAFFIERKKAGLPVDLNADYDFAGSPAQDRGETAEADEIDALG